MTVAKLFCCSSIIRTVFFDTDRKSTLEESHRDALCNTLTSRALADTPIVSVAYIRRALIEKCINPPKSCSLHLGKSLLEELGLNQSLGRRECK
jgi:hypothetical protein